MLISMSSLTGSDEDHPGKIPSSGIQSEQLLISVKAVRKERFYGLCAQREPQVLALSITGLPHTVTTAGPTSLPYTECNIVDSLLGRTNASGRARDGFLEVQQCSERCTTLTLHSTMYRSLLLLFSAAVSAQIYLNASIPGNGTTTSTTYTNPILNEVAADPYA